MYSFILRKPPIIRNLQRQFTSSAGPNQNASSFDRLKNSLYEHRQAILNCLAMFFVVKTSLHEIKLKEAWEEKTKYTDEVTRSNEQLRGRQEALQQKLTDSKWCEEVVEKMEKESQSSSWFKSSPNPGKSSEVLQAEIEKVFVV